MGLGRHYRLIKYSSIIVTGWIMPAIERGCIKYNIDFENWEIRIV